MAPVVSSGGSAAFQHLVFPIFPPHSPPSLALWQVLPSWHHGGPHMKTGPRLILEGPAFPRRLFLGSPPEAPPALARATWATAESGAQSITGEVKGITTIPWGRGLPKETRGSLQKQEGVPGSVCWGDNSASLCNQPRSPPSVEKPSGHVAPHLGRPRCLGHTRAGSESRFLIPWRQNPQ